MRRRLLMVALAVWPVQLAAASDLTQSASAGAATQDAPTTLDTAADVRKHVRGAMRQAALPKGPKENAALRELVAAYELLLADRLLGGTERGEFRRTVRSRLARALDDLQARLEKAQKAQSVKRADVDDREVLAQQLPPPGNPAQPGAGRPRGVPPTNPALDDYGPELVELIQNTIAPDTWDVNGGNGTIVYYRPLRVLVVRQTGDAHESIVDVLGGLRQ